MHVLASRNASITHRPGWCPFIFRMGNVKHTLLRLLQGILFCCGILFIGLLAMRIYEEIRYGHLRPPSTVRNIQDFRRWNPSFRQVQTVTIYGSTYYAVRGPFARSLPSGPSEYYFDHKGNYVGRNLDIGDFDEPAIFSSKDAQRESVEIESIPTMGP